MDQFFIPLLTILILGALLFSLDFLKALGKLMLGIVKGFLGIALASAMLFFLTTWNATTTSVTYEADVPTISATTTPRLNEQRTYTTDSKLDHLIKSEIRMEDTRTELLDEPEEITQL